MSELNKPNHDEQALDLIIDRALGQQDPGDKHPTDDLLKSEMEQAAALLDLAIATSHPVDMPSDLADRIKSQVAQYPDQKNASTQVHSESDQRTPYPFPQETTKRVALLRWVPWVVAAASLLIATVSILMSRGTPGVPDLNIARLALIESTPAEDLTQWDWISTDDPAVAGDVIGDVVWSDTLNKGFMRISGLAINDPSLEQYQLWIFDATNPTAALPQFGEGLLTQRPIDGGVFDVKATREVIIEIDAKLIVEQAAAFAITVEPPGGVVVSDRSRVPLLALAP